MGTTVAGQLSVDGALTAQAGATVNGDLAVTGRVVAAGRDMQQFGAMDLFSWRPPSPGGSNLWNGWNEIGTDTFIVDSTHDSLSYKDIMLTKNPIVAIRFKRGGNTGTNPHSMIGLTLRSGYAENGGFNIAHSYKIWTYNSLNNRDVGVRSACPQLPGSTKTNNEIFHGVDDTSSISDSPDDDFLQDSDEGDIYMIRLDWPNVSFYSDKYQGGQTPFRTCTNAPAGEYIGLVRLHRPPRKLAHGSPVGGFFLGGGGEGGEEGGGWRVGGGM